MKISKLFHWLYAFLMLLPIFAVGVKCGYVMFNKNAKDSYRGDYHFDTNVIITNTDDYRLDTIYSLATNNATITQAFAIGTSHKYKTLNITYTYNASVHTINSDNLNYDYYYFNSSGGIFGVVASTNAQTRVNSFLNTSVLHNGTMSFYDTASMTGAVVNYWQYQTFYVDTTLSSVFYSSLQELDDVEFFSWAKDSFLAQPFMYLGTLFSIPNVHPIFTFLSYWCAISVIYLVFDLIMYIPLLTHRWLDKGMIE